MATITAIVTYFYCSINRCLDEQFQLWHPTSGSHTNTLPNMEIIWTLDDRHKIKTVKNCRLETFKPVTLLLCSKNNLSWQWRVFSLHWVSRKCDKSLPDRSQPSDYHLITLHHYLGRRGGTEAHLQLLCKSGARCWAQWVRQWCCSCVSVINSPVHTVPGLMSTLTSNSMSGLCHTTYNCTHRHTSRLE